MILAFTGPEEVETDTIQEEIIRQEVQNLFPLGPTEFVSGAAFGVDTIAALAARDGYLNCIHRLVVPNGRHNEDLVRQWEKYVSEDPLRTDIDSRVHVVQRMPEGTDHLARNDEMIHRADILIAFPRTPEEEKRSGTWATIRRARRKGIPIHLFSLLSGDFWFENV